MIEVNGRMIDLVESGSGPTLLFLPGSYSTPAAWRPVQKLLSPGYRLAATSLCGYGSTDETRTVTDLSIDHEVQVVAHVARHLGGPVHLVGHSFGGTVALAAALARMFEVASLSLFEANPLALIAEWDDGSLYNETLAMSRLFEAAVKSGEADAPRRVIDFWGGEGSFASMPEPVREYCRKTAPANVIDWRTDLAFAARAADYVRITAPVLLVRGERANPAMAAMTERLREMLPNVRPAVVPGAGHFLISSHAGECARLLDSFLAEVA